MNKIKKIHFAGVKGVGMTPLAIMAKEAGFLVSGSDVDEEFITDKPLAKANIIPLIGFKKEHVEGADFLITTGAHGGFDNPEVIYAKQNNIPVLTQGEAVAEFMKGFLGRRLTGVSVSGCHGKTTVTAMIATILKEANYDPSFLIGTGEIVSLLSPGHFGSGEYFIAEADEYANEPNYDKTPKLLLQKPKIGVITNIEFDHPDLYKSMDDLQETFLKFANNIDMDGCLVACADDIETQKLLRQYKKKTKTYGFSPSADLKVDKVSFQSEKVFFWVSSQNTVLGEFSLNVLGEHNVLNATCAISVCLELGLSIEQINKGLKTFKGTARRSQFMGKTPNGAIVYDDYAHHPSEIKATLAGFRKSFMNKKIVCIFQPHTFSRTKELFEQFTKSFSDADVAIISDIFPSAREKADDSVSSKLLVDEIKNIHKNALYLKNASDVIEYLNKMQFDSNYLIITMGAGDIYKIAKQILG